MAEVWKKVAGMKFVAKLPTTMANGVESISAKDAHAFEVRISRELIRRGSVNAEAFAFIRKAAKLKAAELAKMLDVDPKTVSRWETGEIKIPRSEWAVLARLFSEKVGGRDEITIASALEAAAAPRNSRSETIELRP